MKYDNILQTIGNTPVVKLNRIAPDHVDMYVKVESFNPMASVKDRLAYAIIKDARDSGALQPGQTVIEATSGNTYRAGNGLRVMGHPFVATMVETFSIERRKVMRALGAKVILTPAAERGTGMVAGLKNWPQNTAGLWPNNSKIPPTRLSRQHNGS